MAATELSSECVRLLGTLRRQRRVGPALVDARHIALGLAMAGNDQQRTRDVHRRHSRRKLRHFGTRLPSLGSARSRTTRPRQSLRLDLTI